MNLLPRSPRTGGAVPCVMQPLAPAIQTVWRMRAGLTFGVLLLGALAYDVVHVFRAGWLPPFAASALVLVLGAAYVMLVPRLHYRIWRWSVEDDELHVRYGLWTRVHTIVPLRRIQHLDVAQGLIEREFGVARLVVHTAGTRDSTVTVPGLTRETAEAVRDRVRAYLATDPL